MNKSNDLHDKNQKIPGKDTHINPDNNTHKTDNKDKFKGDWNKSKS